MSNTNPEEFKKFHLLLTNGHPEYEPFYFPLNQKSKNPIEGKSWKKNRLKFEDAYRFMEKGFNIGIAGTDKDKLVIMDKDDIEKVGETKPTLSTVSRKRIGQHCFFFSEDKVSDSIFDDSAKQNIATEDYGEIRANWQYVVCAGSYVPVTKEELDRIPDCDKANAGKYTVLDELPVNSITYAELPQVYKDCLQGKRANEIKVKIDNENKHKEPVRRDSDKSALYNLTIEDVTGRTEDSSKRFASLFHGSDTGKNTSISKGLLHCWRHNVSHTPLTTLAMLAGIGDCGSVGFGHNSSGTSSLDLYDGETVFKLWEYAKKEGYIPLNDPIPSRALVWYAINQKICKPSDIIDGWKLLIPAYNKAIESLQNSCTPPGRGLYKNTTKGKNKKQKEEMILKDLDAGIRKVVRNNIELAEEFQKIVPIYFDESLTYWMWKKDKKYWKKIDKTDILSAIRRNSEEYVVNETFKNEFLEAIRITGRERGVLPIEEHWVHCNNKVFDLKTHKLFDPEITHFYTTPVPHNIGTSYETPTIDKIFHEWMGDKANILYEIGAYCLHNGYPIHRIIWLTGGGRNGKDQYMEFLQRLVGIENTTSTDLDILIDSRFESLKLYKKKIALIAETNFNTLKNTAILKALTGHSLMRGEIKGGAGIDFYNTAKIVISANTIPETTDKTYAWFSRCITLEFKNKFPIGKPIIGTIPEQEYENFIFKCLDKILPELLERGEFTGEGTAEDKEKTYERLSNPFSVFKEKELDEKDGAITAVWILRELYKNFCEKQGYRVVNEKEFTQILKREGYEVKKHRFGEKSWMAVFDLANKNPYIYDENTDDSRNGNIGNVPDVPDVPRVPPNLTQISHVENVVNLPGTRGTCGTSVTELNPENCGICGQLLKDSTRIPGRLGEGEVHEECNKKRVKKEEVAKIVSWYHGDTPFDFDALADVLRNECWKKGVTVPQEEAKITIINAFREVES